MRIGVFASLGQAELTDLLAPLKTRVQADLGKFLQARQVLEQAQAVASLTPDQQLTVSGLLADQAELEGQVSTELGPVQAGTLSVDTVTGAALFLGRMELHLSRVDGLRKQLGLRGDVTVGVAWPTVAMWGGIAVGVLGGATRSWPLMLGGGTVAAVGWYLGR